MQQDTVKDNIEAKKQKEAEAAVIANEAIARAIASPGAIPITPENIPALMEKHHSKIDRSIGYDSDTQQARLRLFEHDPAAMAAHYPELQKKSEELREQNEAIQRSAATAGWIAFAATAAVTGFLAAKKKISDNNLIQGIVVAFSSITAGFGLNALTNKLLGHRVREESKDLASAARIANERELAVYMEDTQRRLAKRAAAEMQKASGPQTSTALENKKWADDKVKQVIETAAAAAKAENHAAAVEKSREGNAATPQV